MNKKREISLLLVLSFFFCCSHKIKYGLVDKDFILSLSKFKEVYKSSKIDENKAKDIKGVMLGINIEVIFGDWCSDSIENVPRLIKILDKINFDMRNATFINADKKRERISNLIKGKNIERLPTIIFIKDGKEIGRIVESPILNLEDDILNILSQHAN